MIRLWISRESSISIREQLSSQLLLGILSRRLAEGEKLPSVRDLARRLEIHGNTVHAIYRDLARRGWVQARPGSGVFVVEAQQPNTDLGIDEMVRNWIIEAQELGHSIGDIEASLRRHSQPVQPQHLLVVDPDPELAKILAAELSEAIGCPVSSASCEAAPLELALCARVIATQGHANEVSAATQNKPLHLIQLKSMQDVLKGQKRPPFLILITIVSRSKSVLAWASTLLSALGFGPETVLLRNPLDEGWTQGLSICTIIAADLAAADEVPAQFRPTVFRLISEASLAEVRQLVTV